MDAKRAASAFGQHGEITASLRGLYYAERVFLLRHFDIDRIIARDLEEHARVRSALVRLTCRVQESRPEFGHGRNLLVVAHEEANLLKRLLIGFVHRDVAENAKVITGVDAAEMRAKDIREL